VYMHLLTALHVYVLFLGAVLHLVLARVVSFFCSCAFN
jgi:hypothetical protein